MPQLGEIKRSQELGYAGRKEYIWHACIRCGRERWVRLVNNQPRHLRCIRCPAWPSRHLEGMKAENHPAWKGGVWYANGYVYIYQPEHPQANNKGYVKRAILILEEKLGRYLLPECDSHHINGIKDDDRPENLEELPHNEHQRLHWEEWRRQKQAPRRK